MPQTVLSGGQSGTLRRGLRDAFDTAYESVAEQTKLALEPVMKLGLPSDTDQEYYSYWQDAPFPRYWPRGEEVAKSGFEAVQFNLINRDFGLEVEWHANDEEDNQNTTGIRQRAANTGTNFGYNPTSAFFDLILGTTNFLPASITAPDAAAIFATTAGGSARFGATNGNLLTSTGNNSFSSPSVLRADIWTAIQQFSLFQNTQGKPLFAPQVLKSGYELYYGAGNTDIFAEAFLGTLNTFSTVTAGNVAVPDSVGAAGYTIKGNARQEITDNDAFLFLTGVDHKPFFQQLRKPPTEQDFDEGNSKGSARNLLRSMIWHERAAYGVWLPYGVIKLNGT